MAVVKGKVLYSHLQEPSKEENGFKAKYSVDLIVDSATKDRLLKEGGTLKVNKKTGQEYFNFWSNAKNKEGRLNPPIKVVDAKKHSISAEPGSGSIINVQYNPVEWNFAGKKGIMLALGAVQVIDLQERGVGEFDEVDGYTVSSSAASEFDDLDDFNSDVPF